jgi:hypothetical protein
MPALGNLSTASHARSVLGDTPQQGSRFFNRKNSFGVGACVAICARFENKKVVQVCEPYQTFQASATIFSELGQSTSSI